MTYTVNCSILLTELPLLERPAAAKAAGFDAVEFWWPFESSVPSDAETTAFERAIGERLGCKAFNALYGNRQEEFSTEEQDDLAARNLAAAAEGVARIGGTVLLEPVSGAPRYPLLKAQDALDVIARVKAESGARNIKLLADFYHLAVNGDNVGAVIENHAKEFGHIQIADNPGRGAPGTGELPLGEWIARSRELGYEGYLGLEYKEPQDTAFSWAIREHAAN
jgi:hydroxypyruvate isomerase